MEGNKSGGNSLVVQWLVFGLFIAEGLGSSFSGQGVKIRQSHAVQPKKKHTRSNTIYKNKLKMDQRPEYKYKARHYKTLRGKHRQNIL